MLARPRDRRRERWIQGKPGDENEEFEEEEYETL